MEKDKIELAIENIAKYGDTDIFPFPIEKLMFFDEKDKVVELIEKIDSDLSTVKEDVNEIKESLEKMESRLYEINK